MSPVGAGARPVTRRARLARPFVTSLVLILAACTSSAPSPSPSTAEVPATPTVTPFATATSQGVTDPQSPTASLASPSASPAGRQSGWVHVIAPVQGVAWSPDGTFLTIALSSNIARLGIDEIYGFEVRDRGGNLVDNVLGQDPIGWLDDTHILAYSGLGDSFDQPGYSTS